MPGGFAGWVPRDAALVAVTTFVIFSSCGRTCQRALLSFGGFCYWENFFRMESSGMYITRLPISRRDLSSARFRRMRHRATDDDPLTCLNVSETCVFAMDQPSVRSTLHLPLAYQDPTFLQTDHQIEVV